MDHVNADMGAIIALANEIDAYQAELHRLQARLGEQFVNLAAEGHWTDARYAAFRKDAMEPLGDELGTLHALIDNDLKPFLHDVYQRLTEYRDA